MAGAEAAVQRVICERPKVSQRLIKGSKFLKWPKSDGDDSSFVPVTLRVDPNGYILYWQEPSKDAECVDIATIRDTRTGHYAKTPKQEKTQRALQNFLDPHQYKSLTQSGVQLHEICFTVVCGCNLVNITYYNFIAVESNPTVVLSVRFRTCYLIKIKFCISKTIFAGVGRFPIEFGLSSNNKTYFYSNWL